MAFLSLASGSYRGLWLANGRAIKGLEGLP